MGFFLGWFPTHNITSCVSLLEVDYICVVNEFVQVRCNRRFVGVFFFAPFTLQKDPFYVCYVMAFWLRFLHSLHLILWVCTTCIDNVILLMEGIPNNHLGYV